MLAHYISPCFFNFLLNVLFTVFSCSVYLESLRFLLIFYNFLARLRVTVTMSPELFCADTEILLSYSFNPLPSNIRQLGLVQGRQIATTFLLTLLCFCSLTPKHCFMQATIFSILFVTPHIHHLNPITQFLCFYSHSSHLNWTG